MKTKLLVLLTLGFFAFQSCSDSDKDKTNNYEFVSQETKMAQSNKYPNVKTVEWEKKGNYMVAEFYHQNHEVEAWYDNKGEWFMTETDIRENELPQAVTTTFNTTEYRDWKKDDIDKIERKGVETIYVIEVEKKGQSDVKIRISESGILLDIIIENAGNSNNNENLIQGSVTPEVKAILDEKFKGGYGIHDVEKEMTPAGTFLEVEILHDRRKKDVYFNDKNQWVGTKWEIRRNEIPTTVENGINNSQYAQWKIDDVDQVETADGTFFYIEFEKGKDEVKVFFNEEGKEVKLF